jgi:hypothetical protein
MNFDVDLELGVDGPRISKFRDAGNAVAALGLKMIFSAGA